MVAKSLEIHDSIANDGGSGVVSQHLMVSAEIEMSPKLKISVKYGAKKAEPKDTPMSQRRSSSRIQAAKLKEVEEVKLRRNVEVVEDRKKSSVVVTAKGKSNKRVKKSHGEGEEESTVKEEVVSESQSKSNEEDASEKQVKNKEEVASEKLPKKKKSAMDAKRELMEVWDEKMKVDSENTVDASAEKSYAAKVKDTIRLFNKHYLHLVQVSYFYVIVFLLIALFCLK